MCSGAACLSGTACLHLQVEKGLAVLPSWSHYVVKRVALPPWSGLVSSEEARALLGGARCEVLGRSWLGSMCCASQNTSPLLQMVFLGERALIYCV